MHAALPLPKSPLISSYQQQKHLALISVISIYFYCWWMEDVSFQTPLAIPCKHSHTKLQKNLILKPEPAWARNHKHEPGSSPKFIFESRFRPEN